MHQPVEPTWPRLRESPGRRVVALLCGSAVVHLAFTPLAALVVAAAGWLQPLGEQAPEAPERLMGLSVDLVEMALDGAATPSGQSAESDPDSPSPPGDGTPKAQAVSLGVPMVAGETPSGPKAQPIDPAEPRRAQAELERRARHKAQEQARLKRAARARRAAAEAAREGRAKRAKTLDPVARAGVRSRALSSNAKVNLLLYNERIREHRLAPRLTRVLLGLPQWRSFMVGEVDPVQDVDRLLMVGTSFRRTADVVAVVRHRLKAGAVRSAVDALVERSPSGRWLGTKPPAALARADRAQRLIALLDRRTLVVAPPHLRRAVLKSGGIDFPEPAGDELGVLLVRQPRATLGRLPVALPASVKWLRLVMSPRADGGATVMLTAEDASPAKAARHASELSAAVNALTNPSLGRLGALLGVRRLSFLDRITLRARGPRLEGTLGVSPRQLERLLALLESQLQQASPAGSVRPKQLAETREERLKAAPRLPARGVGKPAAGSTLAPR